MCNYCAYTQRRVVCEKEQVDFRKPLAFEYITRLKICMLSM